jgi:histidinol-phosphatase (PHP family)
VVLEINTSGGELSQRFCPGLVVVKWWYEAGGKAISLGSDAHEPAELAAGFQLASRIAEEVGFHAPTDATHFSRR